ncbi:hypothetical protein [Melghirimyces algeriensis]|uniref:Uncharacterized protein n=1 Tax=Melghirimyces algeriensis TaxID=910412 RepID=A0A521FDY5_9BACL|nr:hypothetical protein [Melghirimyces algeriensis]SMO94377.1 hypothetical protein SAMN06264849_11711 [Melghirimyces algeriensis]
MRDAKEVTSLIFRLIVQQLENMPEQDRLICRVEALASELDITLKSGEEYRVRISRINPSYGNEESMVDRNQENRREKRVAIEDWEDLIDTCETVIQFLEYDKKKMEELTSLVPDFPWENRSRMMEDVLNQLKSSLYKFRSDQR